MSLSRKSQGSVTISTETIIKAIGLAFLFFVLLRLVGSLAHELTLIGVSFFLAIALNPAVSWITPRLRSRSRTKATGMAYVLVLTILIGFLSLVVPPLVEQTADFINDLPETVESFRDQDSAIGRFVRQHGIDDQLSRWSEDLENQAGDLISPALDTASRAVGTVVSVITVLVLTFMMLIEGPLWVDRLLALQPASKRKGRRRILNSMYRVVTGYVNGQVLIAGIAAGFTLLAILIGNVIFDTAVNAVALAGISFLFALIPLVGNIIAAVLIALICLFASPALAIYIAIYYIVYQQIENATIQPYIQARTNQLTPLIIFVSALLGAGIGGLLGALTAIPVAGCIRVLVDEYLAGHGPTQADLKEA